MNKWMSILASAIVLTMSSVTFAQAQQQPATNVFKGHPNLVAAQHFCAQAIQKLLDSQKANEYDEGGHARKAEELLGQAKAEIVKAAAFDNAHGK